MSKLLRAMALLVFAFAVGSCTCSEKKSKDHELLEKKLDHMMVHTYVGLKVTVAEAQSDASLEAMRATLIKFIAESAQRPSSETAKNAVAGLSFSEMASLAQAVLSMSSKGKEAMKSGSDRTMGPIIPKIVTAKANSATVLDANSEHALLMLGFLVARANPRMPVPVPEQLILYEASRTEPNKLPHPGLVSPAYAARSYLYGQHELCDLAVADAEQSIATQNPQALVAGINGLFQLKNQGIDPGMVGYLQVGFEGLAHGATTLCYWKRGEEEKGRKSLRRMLESMHKIGISTPETEILWAYIECADGAETAPAGLARLQKLSGWPNRVRRETNGSNWVSRRPSAKAH
jgi:hypothetical protein